MDKLGKGMFIWMLSQCADGDPEALAEMAVDAGISWVQIKIQHSYDNVVYEYNSKYIEKTVEALRAKDISIYGWGWIIGADFNRRSIAREEALVASNVVNKYDLDGFIPNAEAQYKRPGSDIWAREYLLELRHNIGNKPIGLSSYRYPTVHRGVPWHIFADYCDFWCPQVYWVWAHNPVQQLQRSIRELTAIKDLPIIPTGAAYKELGWGGPSVAELDRFDAKVQELELPGITWWSWQAADGRLDWWNAITAHDWGIPSPEEKHKVEVLHPNEVEITTRQIS